MDLLKKNKLMMVNVEHSSASYLNTIRNKLKGYYTYNNTMSKTQKFHRVDIDLLKTIPLQVHIEGMVQ